MNRFALIIEASDVKGQTALPGAKQDAINWYNFLTSNVGGGWRQDEIVILNKPSRTLVTYYLVTHNQDYCFVAYSGHGCELKSSPMQTTGIPTVCLNDTEQQVPLSVLTPQSQYGTLISDSCRGHEILQKTASNFSNRGDSYTLASEDIADIYTSLLHCKKWHQALKQCCLSQSGILTMYSCASGQSADEDPYAGGVYTSLLINVAKSWYGSAQSNTYYTTYDAHQQAAQLMKQYAPQQIPEYNKFPLKFPFAVKA